MICLKKYTLSEKKVLKKLKIPDFRHMTKDSVVKFATMLPYMDPDVAKAAIEQFPAYADMSGQMISHYKEILNDIVKSNDNSMNGFFNTCNSIIASLQEELQRDDLSSDERNRIEDNMIKVAQMISEKDTENKHFLIKTAGIFGLVLSIGAFAGATVLGANSQMNADEIESDDKDDYIDVQ